MVVPQELSGVGQMPYSVEVAYAMSLRNKFIRPGQTHITPGQKQIAKTEELKTTLEGMLNNDILTPDMDKIMDIADQRLLSGEITEGQYLSLNEIHRRRLLGEEYKPLEVPHEFSAWFNYSVQ